MPRTKTDAHADMLLLAETLQAAYAGPAATFAGLLTTLPASDGTGFVEAVGVGYQRGEIVWSGTPEDIVVDGITKRCLRNTNLIALSSGMHDALGNILGVGFFESTTEGADDLWRWMVFDEPLLIAEGVNPIQILPSALALVEG